MSCATLIFMVTENSPEARGTMAAPCVLKNCAGKVTLDPVVGVLAVIVKESRPLGPVELLHPPANRHTKGSHTLFGMRITPLILTGCLKSRGQPGMSDRCTAGSR